MTPPHKENHSTKSHGQLTENNDNTMVIARTEKHRHYDNRKNRHCEPAKQVVTEGNACGAISLQQDL
ncbi:hypothetical protein [Kangiella shandongensis]|uniref:hypothetical protein n=1 Tax=Kangiella shandongensis TaxID=2763258 RepID=UPI001CBCF4EC|nr:hypothetical protein [Kangiella shandongensis]